MGKQKLPRTLADNEASAIVKNLKTSPRKLNLVAGTIRNQPVEKALSSLMFSRRRIAKDVHKALQSAIANAENNHQLDIDKLVVKRAEVGKSVVMKRFHARARGRSGRIQKMFAHLTIVVAERTEEKKAAPAKKPAAKKAPAKKAAAPKAKAKKEKAA